MSDLKYTEDHEWLRLEDDGLITVGITDYAQEQLGDVVYVELPQVGDELSTGDEAAVVESVKAAGEIKMPVAGEIVEINDSLADQPELINKDPAGSGWFIQIKATDEHEIDQYMNEDDYKEFVAGL